MVISLKDSLKEGETLPVVKTVYFEEPNPFPETISFMSTIKDKFSLTEIKLPRDFKKSLAILVNQHDLQAVVMGSRRTDPYCENQFVSVFYASNLQPEKLERISPSDVDKGYPPFLRINPIIDWTYEQVWEFLRHFEIPYCNLYEKGFTYLGNQTNTLQNTQLLQNNGSYLPAWEANGEDEQGSRKEGLTSNSNKQIQHIAIVIGEYKNQETLKQLSEDYQKVILINTTKDEEIQNELISIKPILNSHVVQVDLYFLPGIHNTENLKHKFASEFTIRKVFNL